MKKLTAYALICLFAVTLFAQNPDADGGRPDPESFKFERREKPGFPERPEPPLSRNMRKGPPDFHRHIPKDIEDDFLSGLSETERAELQLLKKTDLREFQKRLFAYLQKKREEDVKKLEQLRKDYMEATDPEEKEKAKKTLYSYLEERIQRNLDLTERQLKRSEERLKEMETRINEFRKKYEALKAGKSQAVEKSFQKFTNPDFKFGRPSPHRDRPPNL